jgi:hypothetical protein
LAIIFAMVWMRLIGRKYETSSAPSFLGISTTFAEFSQWKLCAWRSSCCLIHIRTRPTRSDLGTFVEIGSLVVSLILFYSSSISVHAPEIEVMQLWLFFFRAAEVVEKKKRGKVWKLRRSFGAHIATSRPSSHMVLW